MQYTVMNSRWTRTLVVMLLAGAIVACRPKPPETLPTPDPPAPELGALPDASAGEGALAEVGAGAGPVDAAGAVATPATGASARASAAPDVSKMALARAVSSKLGVPVDLRYQFEDAVEEGRPVTLHLAAVPRVEGSNLTVSIKESAGIEAHSAPLSARKADASAAYRQQLSVTRHAGAPEEMRVLVTMDVAEGSAFGYFSVPMGAAPAR